MSRDISSVRLARLHRLMRCFVENGSLSRKFIEETVGYNSTRTLQNDLCFLRDEYMVEVSYSKKLERYEMSNAGTFFIYIGVSSGEVDALVLGLKMVSCLLPHLCEPASALRKKLSFFFPQCVSARGDVISEKIMLCMSSAAADKDVFIALTNALCEGKSVEIFDKPFLPHSFSFCKNSWSVKGLCLESSCEKTYLLKDISLGTSKK